MGPLKRFASCFLLLIGAAFVDAQIHQPNPEPDKVTYEQAAAGDWREVFSDPCTGDWRKQWFMDGEVGTVTTGPQGMTLTAGPEFKNDAHHMVLWNLLMRVENAERAGYFHFRNPHLPVITEDRVGLRHMFTRSARYRNFRISIPQV